MTRCRATPAAHTSGARSWYASSRRSARTTAPALAAPPAPVSGPRRQLERRAGGGPTRSTCARTRWQQTLRRGPRRRGPARCRAPGRHPSARCTAQRCDCDPPAQRGHGRARRALIQGPAGVHVDRARCGLKQPLHIWRVETVLLPRECADACGMFSSAEPEVRGVLLLFVRYINTCVCFMSSSQVVKIIVGFGSRIGSRGAFYRI